MCYSIIIPTFNRSQLIQRSIDSVLLLFSGSNLEYEIIVVDDASVDNTKELIDEEYSEQIKSGILHYHYLKKNVGVTAAKNFGALSAKFERLIFLDSDDELINDLNALESECEMLDKYGLVFFRCVSFENGHLIGQPFEYGVLLNSKDYMDLRPFPECLPVIHQKVFEKISYSSELRGFEGILYMQHLFEGGLIYLSPKILRRYRQFGTDTISSSAKSKDRLAQLAKGSKALASLALNHRQFRFFVKYFCRFVYYSVRGFVS